MAVKQSNRIYKTVNGVQLALHIFNDSRFINCNEKPAIIFFFGGGWVQGTPAQFYEHCKHCAAKGFVAISAEYHFLNSVDKRSYWDRRKIKKED